VTQEYGLWKNVDRDLFPERITQSYGRGPAQEHTNFQFPRAEPIIRNLYVCIGSLARADSSDSPWNRTTFGRGDANTMALTGRDDSLCQKLLWDKELE